MSSIGSPSPFFLAGKKAYQVERSLRFNDNDSAYLNRTPSSNTNRTTFTLSVWVKRGNFGEMMILDAREDDSNRTRLLFDAGNRMQLFTRLSGNDHNLIANAVRRDCSEWYHLVWSIDTTQATASNRVKMYVNNELQTLTGSNYPDQNEATFVNKGVAHTIGTGQDSGGNEAFFDGYMAEINFIDGQAYDPSYFGETSAATGQWNPKKYTGSYGTNGFYLNFSENSGTTATTLGKDSSGNGNNFTPNNFSVAAGAGNDSLEDTPTNNFPTFNPLIPNVNTFSEGNLQVTMTSNAPPSFYSTMGVSSGKYYMEFLVKSNNNYPLGISGSTQASNYFSLGDQIGFWLANTATRVYRNGSNITSNSVVVGNFETGVEGTSTSWAVDDIAGLALDMDNKIIYLYKGSTQVGYVNFSTFNYDTVFFGGGNYINGNVYIGNFGQRPFAHTPPTGYKALCSANLPNPTVLQGNKHFDTLLYTGDGSSSHTITGLNFQPDWAWIKNRSNSYHHGLFDAVRGANKVLKSSDTSAEGTFTQQLMSFNSDGFTLGDNSDSGNYVNINGHTYVGWNWNAGETDSKTYTVKVVSDSGNKYRFDNFGTSAVTLDLAEGGTYIFNMDDASNASHPFSIGTAANGTVYTSGITYFLDGVSKTYSEYTSGFAAATTRRLHITVPASAPVLYYWCSAHSGMGGQINTNSTLGSSNFDGSKQTVVKANASAGFSIISYTGDGNSGATTGHGLGVAPKIMFHKDRDSSNNWYTITTAVDGSADYLYLNLTNSKADSGVTAPTSNLVYFTASSESNHNGRNYIMYAFSEVAGYSKFGSYIGNGNANGPFVFTGFRPAFVISKRIDSTSSWQIWDNTRDTYNVTTHRLRADVSNAEDTGSVDIDLLSNGFKLRNTGINQSNGTYLYLAFAESPFKNARAR